MIGKDDLRRVVSYQFLFFCMAGSYVIYNMIVNPMTFSEYMWGYDNKYRLVGLTGYAIDLDGNLDRLENTTSVSMGVFIALIFLIQLSLYKKSGRIIDLIKLGFLLCFEMLVYSRAGLVVLGVGIAYFLLLYLKPTTLIRFILFSILVTIGAFVFDLSEAGTLKKVTELSLVDDPRWKMVLASLEYFSEHPLALITGIGYGEKYSELAIGYPHLESLFLTSLFSSGFLAVLLLTSHFFSVWITAKRKYLSTSKSNPYLLGIRLFVPGWFLSSFIAGNTFQTDFYFPFVYFIFICATSVTQNSE